MKTSLTLGRYLAKTYILNTLAILSALLLLIYLLDTIELLRRAGKMEGVSLSLVLQMGLLKLPEVGQIVFPFAILFSAILTFWQLNRRSELVVLRASGFSVWQFLAPLALLAALIGVLQVGIINPVSAVLIGKYERLENEHLNRQDNSQIALFRGGLWLRQSIDGRPFEDNREIKQGYVILHARKIDQADWALQDVMALYFEQNDRLLMRLDAHRAVLEKGRWLFEDVSTHRPGTPAQKSRFFALPTNLTLRDIEDSFSSPESMSFWNLPSHIQTLEETGFDASRLRVHYQALLAQPLFLAAMVLLAATVSVRPPRTGGTLRLLVGGLLIGFAIFFLSSYLEALGYSGQIPPLLAAWSPVLICLLSGLSVIIYLEDG